MKVALRHTVLRAGLVLALAVAGVLIPGAAVRPAVAAPLFTTATTAYTTNADPVVGKSFAIVGQVFLVLGDSPAPLPNRTVILERRSTSTQPWGVIARTTTVQRTLANGEKHIMYTFNRTAYRSAYYRVRYDAGDDAAAIGGSVSKTVSVRVHRQMPIRLSQPQPGRIYMTGSVRPLFAWQRVTINRKKCAKCAWSLFARPMTDRYGRFKVRLSIPRSGSHYFIAKSPATKGFAVTYSQKAQIRAR